MIFEFEIELKEEEVEYLKWFKAQNKPVINNNYPITFGLEYLGILLNTPIDENGVFSDNIYVLPTEIGKLILEKL